MPTLTHLARSTATGQSLTIQRHSDWSAVSALAPAWRNLQQAQSHATVFAGHGFTRALWRTFGEKARCDLIDVRAGDQIVGLMPMTWRPIRRGGIRYNEVGFFRNHHTLRNALLVAPEMTEAVLAALMAAMAGSGGWQMLFLENIPADATLLSQLDDAAAAQGLLRDAADPGRRLCYAAIETDWEQYRATLSKSMRWQLKKFRRRAEETGRLEFLRLSARHEIAAALPDVFALRNKSWQGQTHDEHAVRAADEAFDHALVEDLDEDEVGDLWLLKIDGRLVASLRMLASAQRRHVHTMHYDPAAKELSPGSLLFEKMLETAWADRLAEVDFHGDSAFFRRWTSQARENVTARFYPSSAFGRILQMGRRLRHRWRAGMTPHDN